MEIKYITHPIQFQNEKPKVMALGFFDGVHLGHQELLRKAKEIARRKNAICSVMTFYPHPSEVLTGKNRTFITPLVEKINKMKQFGIERLYIVRFDKAFASVEPMDFIQKYIISMNVKHVVVGFDYTFGKKAKGNIEVLERVSANGDFGLSVIQQKSFKNEKISSTRIRSLISEGNVSIIPYLLGSHYKIKTSIYYNPMADAMEIKPLWKFIMPESGSYYVEVIFGKNRFFGRLDILNGENYENRLYINGALPDWNEECEIVFLNNVSHKHSITV